MYPIRPLHRSNSLDIFIFVGLGIIAVFFLIYIILRKKGKKISPYLLFGIIDGTVGLLALAFALFDFKVSTGEFAGIMGEIVLIIAEPVVIILLIIDVVLWLVNKNKKIS